MTEHIILVCVLACIVCPVLALASIIFSNHNTNRHIRSTEAQFLRIYRRSEERIDRTNEMVCKLSSCVDKTENLLITITYGQTTIEPRQGYRAERRPDKAERYPFFCRYYSAYQHK